MLKFNYTLVLLLIISLQSCSGGSDGGIEPPPQSEDVIPTNLNLSITIVGANANNPNGDGSGMIQCIATATNAVKYGFKFGNNPEQESLNGSFNHTYTEEGTNSYIVTVFAYSSTGNSISVFKNITVYVASSGPQLIWSDEFDVDGAPNTSKWNYDLGDGSGAGQPGAGWGNNEKQFYTDRSDNVKVENGLLKITLKKESYQGYQYTSTRMKTQDKFEFTYGKIEIKAKLPSGGGTWPAFWTLGANIDEGVGWPACGEIDIMEHVGNNEGTIQSAMHTPSSYGNTQNKGSQVVSNVTSAFHIYALEWTQNKMIFSVDGNVHYTYQPNIQDSNTWPFNANQFILINIAMGGNLGGVIDSNFTETTMEIDYVRVYQ
ncbi:family 16 glycosylhydrolase [Geojedonia litorea]|uniref:Family 16 glycosylhydrolase n=1 Tax=Geojedonia litorea TaxID=1268269 RepID=A0ABV9N0U6_9FLAO